MIQGFQKPNDKMRAENVVGIAQTHHLSAPWHSPSSKTLRMVSAGCVRTGNCFEIGPEASPYARCDPRRMKHFPVGWKVRASNSDFLGCCDDCPNFQAVLQLVFDRCHVQTRLS